jgi:hypothetical protein
MIIRCGHGLSKSANTENDYYLTDTLRQNRRVSVQKEQFAADPAAYHGRYGNSA